MAKNTAIGQRTKHVDIRAQSVNDIVTVEKTLIVDHIQNGKNPSDGMTKNLPDNFMLTMLPASTMDSSTTMSSRLRRMLNLLSH